MQRRRRDDIFVLPGLLRLSLITFDTQLVLTTFEKSLKKHFKAVVFVSRLNMIVRVRVRVRTVVVDSD